MMIRCWTDRVADGIEGVADKLRSYRKSRWGVVSASVQGAQHRHTGLPNQDAVATRVDGHGGKRAVVAVADGHGHGLHFRSGVGSQLAVETALEVVERALATSVSVAEFTEVLGELPHQMVRAWQRRVAMDLLEHPFVEGELSRLEAHRVSELLLRPALAYGTTLLVGVLTDTFLAALQIGDGDIVTIDEGARASRPIRSEEVLAGEETHSLCEAEATRYFRTCFTPHGALPPAGLVVSTDGYAKSYPHADADFLRVGPDILNSLRVLGRDKVEHDLPHWLTSCSEEGSRDDITVAVIYRDNT